jgi:hypothetical protein
MKCVLMVVTALGLMTGAASGQEKEKEKPKVGALMPSPLDKAFEKGTTERDITTNLLNDPTYQKAVKEAVKAKKDREAAIKGGAKIGPSPAQAARTAFLRVLQGEAEKDGK